MSDMPRLRVNIYTDPYEGNSLGEIENFWAVAADFDFKYQNWQVTLPDNTVRRYAIGQPVEGHKVTDVSIRPW